ncbi:MAG TPA: class I SAM-dependent RNA methyltransferase [Candidatus Binataceae bacterium]|jgi:23S rRNA (uracil1939-C5)-methyltransferase|nr:class I SAM-dependent RNA methyltransferase [Candidatus Binataceae bacterium]
MPEVEINTMTFGPYGVGRIEGKSVMVSHAVPGDLLEVVVTAERSDYAIARIERVVRPGANRRAAPCAYLPRCGGCDWQQIDYPAQVMLKAQLIASEFRRVLGLDLDVANLIESAPAEFAYRSRTRFQTAAGGGVGFHEAGSNAIVEISRCMVAAQPDRIPTALASALGRRCAEIEVVCDRDGEVHVASLAKRPGNAEVARAHQVMRSDGLIRGIVLRGGGAREVVGAAKISFELEPECVIEIDADLFSQVNRAQNLRLVATVLAMAEVRDGMSVLDLFCGAGNFSLPLARRGARVTGVDADALAIAGAQNNAVRLGFKHAQFIAMMAAETARFFERAHYRPDLVIIDPPRSGALDLMPAVARLRPRAVIYVSCDATTLVRDLQSLCAGGYGIDRVRAFDFFPNTHHAEVAVRALLT